MMIPAGRGCHVNWQISCRRAAPGRAATEAAQGTRAASHSGRGRDGPAAAAGACWDRVAIPVISEETG
eukprot:413280-Hanusia_phi.AAC.1